MTDKPRAQQTMAVDLGDLVEILPESDRWPFVDAFWKTMVREWHGIDRLRYDPNMNTWLFYMRVIFETDSVHYLIRLDKFLYLVRVYLNHCFQLASRSDWQRETVNRLNGILQDGALKYVYYYRCMSMHPG